MKTVLGFSLVTLLLLFATAALAESQVITLKDADTGIHLLEQTGDALHYRVDVSELNALTVATPGGDFTRLIIPGYHHSHAEGAPELPMINRLVELPYGATASVEILSVQNREIDLRALGLADPLMPAQPSMPKSADPETWPFIYHPETYLDEPVARDLVKVVDLGRLRAVDIGRIEVSPISYFPGRNKLQIAESIEFRIHFNGGDLARETELKALTHSPFFRPLYDQIDGYRGLHDNYPDRVRDVVTMVVVAPPEFEYQLADFVDWKTQRGFITILAITGTPEVGVTKEEIRDYIHDLYNNATPELPAPSFVLFVGDTGNMPTWTEGGNVTDRPYCDVEGDLVPDIFYGRFSATNPTMLQHILDKTLMYDTYSMPDPSYLHEVVMIAGMDGGYGAVWANGQINYGTTYYFNADHDIYSHTYLYPESGGNAANIVQNVSDGVSYINYTAHGSTTSWSDPSFTQSNINSLQNYGEYCLAVGNCCLTSSYEVGECFAETWLRAEDKGAIGYIGGSDSTYWDEDYWWGVGSGTVVVNPTYETHGIGAYDGVFHDHDEAMTQWYVTNDALIFSGNIAVMEGGSGMVNYYWTIYNLMGDPSISTWIGTPQINPVDCPAAIMSTWSSIDIDAVPNSYCGLTQDGELMGAGTVDETGQLELEFWEMLMPGEAQLIVMAQFCEPCVLNLPVLPPEGPYVVFSACSVLDSDGDDDGTLDEGELVGLEVTLENVGIDPSTGLTVQLSSTDPHVTVLEGEREYPDIPAGGFACCTEPFLVQVAGDIPDEHRVEFLVHAVGNEGSWDDDFPLDAEAPVLRADGVIINDSTGGNGDGNANAGENFVLRLRLSNDGHSDAEDLSGLLACWETEATVLQGSGGCANVSAGGSAEMGDFIVELSLDCPEPAHIDLLLAASATNGFSANLTFDLPVGGWFDDMEEDRGWTVGAPGDDASAGHWVCVDPIGTTYNGNVCQAENDHTPDPGTLCFITGQHVPGESAGYADVDGGKTSLLTPVFHLDGATSAIISYWRWYTNDLGNNPAEDWWDVEVTSDGQNWTALEHTQASAEEWLYFEFELSAYVTLTDQVQIRFVAADEGSGSLVEAGVDDFLLEAIIPAQTGVDDSSGTPRHLSLGSNFPNPFNPKTTLRFGLPEAGEVELSIFDVMGRKIVTLVDGSLEAGHHEIIWNGRDAAGLRAASGIYFSRLVFADEAKTGKMILLK